MIKFLLAKKKPLIPVSFSLLLIFSSVIPVESSQASSTSAASVSGLEIRLAPDEDGTNSSSYKGFTESRSGTVQSDVDWTSDWYACDSKTTFKSTETGESGKPEVADEEAVDQELTDANCSPLPTSGIFNPTNTGSDPDTKYSFVEFDAEEKQFVSLKLTGAVSGETTTYAVSDGFDRPEVTTSPVATVSGNSISTTVASFSGDYSLQTNQLFVCETQLPGATDQSRFSKESAFTANSCQWIEDENGNIPTSVDNAGIPAEPGQPFSPMDLGGKYISMVSNVGSTVWEVSEGFLVPGGSNATPTPAPYSGPIITDIGEDNISAPFSTFGGQEVRVDGERLATVNKVFVDGKE